MEYKDYKKEWNEFFDTNKLLAFGSASIDLSRLSCVNSTDLATDLTRKVIEKFAYTLSHGRYYKYFVLSEWANQFVRKDLIDRAKELIEKTRKDDGE